MCRIAGVLQLNSEQIDMNNVAAMRDTMILGGPDSSGIWCDEAKSIAFGHRRLAILDLSSAGHQPMLTNDGRYVVTYNGEIYNFKELRANLEKSGHRFQTETDTEVLLKSFELEGVDCVKKFKGMFAFAIWDNHERKLVLVRDRIGVKPLYYKKTASEFIFGSELKALVKHKNFDKKISTQALQLFLQYSYVPAPYSIFDGCYKLEPGHWLEIDILGNIKVLKWWSISNKIETNVDWNDEIAVKRELKDRLIKSFDLRMVSDVPVGLFLSGGIDSSLLLSLLSEGGDRRLDTFTIGFNEVEYNEAESAKQLATQFKTNHHELYLDAEQSLPIIDSLYDIWDEPFGDTSSISTYLVCNFASKYVKVALSADGGDELFGGYPKYWLSYQRNKKIQKYKNLLKLLTYVPDTVLDKLAKNGMGNKLLKVKDILSFSGDPLLNTFVYGQHNFTDFQLSKLLDTPTSKRFYSTKLAEIKAMQSNDPLFNMLALDLQTYHVDDIHVKVDRASMANSLEAREPFLDQDVVEFAFAMPSKYKIPNFDSKNSKYILRKILGEYVDDEFLNRPKKGFGVPLDKWLQHELKHLIERYLSKDFLRKQGIFCPDYTESIIKAFHRKPKQELNKIWNLISFQLWYEKWS